MVPIQSYKNSVCYVLCSSLNMHNIVCPTDLAPPLDPSSSCHFRYTQQILNTEIVKNSLTPQFRAAQFSAFSHFLAIII